MIIFYKTKLGKEPVKEFLEKRILTKHTLRKVHCDIENLENYGLRLKENKVKYMGNKLYELRIDRIRIFFIIFKNNYILLSAFFKKTQKTPKNELAKAKKYQDDYMERIK